MIQCWANVDTLRCRGKNCGNNHDNDGITYVFTDINTALFDLKKFLIDLTQGISIPAIYK